MSDAPLSTSYGNTLRAIAAIEPDPARSALFHTLSIQIEIAISKAQNAQLIDSWRVREELETLHAESLAAIGELAAYRAQIPDAERDILRAMIYAHEDLIEMLTRRITALEERHVGA